ncbi:hypothetical protein [Noviherbaspirillum soli]|uniref:hypothetical protein n=1 Tax=Noviherbaspirillum soli TaxID=1064518 RepID=UPI00188B948D|nr:hypothetical protein [Noviherbaspirillum soli]
MTIKTRLIELLRLARHDATLADKLGKATTVENKIDVLQESSAQNAIPLDCTDLAAGGKAPIDDSMLVLSDEDIHGIVGGSIELANASDMTSALYEQEARTQAIDRMRSQGRSEELISSIINAPDIPLKGMVLTSNNIDASLINKRR